MADGSLIEEYGLLRVRRNVQCSSLGAASGASEGGSVYGLMSGRRKMEQL